MIVFDTETTGLPAKDLNWETDFEQFPHIASIAWIDVGDDGSKENHYLIKPNGYEIPEEATKIHGISNEQAKKDGHDEELVLRSFLFDCYLSKRLIAHNIYFDISIIKANCLRYRMNKDLMCEILDKNKRFDTMKKAMPIMGVSKWPKLTEMYQFFFKKDFDDQHTAIGDVKATLKCYHEIIKSNEN